MERAFSAARSRPEIALGAAGTLLVAGIWLVALVAGIPADEAALANLGLVSAAIAVAVALAAIRLSGGFDRAPPLPEGFAGAPEPAALSRRGGSIAAVNPAMRALAPETGAGLDRLLESVVETDGRMIYRLARGAGTFGFAFEEVRTRDGGSRRYLLAREIADGWLVWSLVSPPALAPVLPAAVAGRYETAPFAHAVVDAGRVVSTNLRFRTMFSSDATAALAPLFAQGEPRDGRCLLKLADGSYALKRAIVSAADTAEGGDGGAMDVFLFDLDPDEAERRGAGVGLERIPVAVLQVSPDGRLIWLNGAARGMLGAGAVPGVGLDRLVELRGRPLASLLDEAIVEGRQSQPETVRTPGGAPNAFAQIGFFRVDLDGEQALFAVLTDASELRQLEDKFAQSQKMEAVGKLAGGVAHDFNNLLTAINGHCDLLLLGRDASQPDYADLNQIKQNANRAAALVRQLLAFSRKQTLNPALISLKDVVSDTLYLLVRLIGDRVQLALDHARDGDPAMVRADRQQLEQALMNLVVNARDAMPEGGTVTISTRSRVFAHDEKRQGAVIPRGAYVELAVADEGSGIDDGIIGKVFDPFFTTKPLGEGTGLGLSTVYGIVKQSGGFIFAENRPEGGACFRILLPQAEMLQAAGAAETAQDARPDLTGHASVLLVEDEASVRSVAARALTLRGYQVTAVDSARDALALVESEAQAIDLVISDVMMPGMDGPSFAARARELRPGLRVLFISGYAEEAFRKNMSDPGDAFLAKPFSIAELAAKVKEVLGDPAGG